MEAFLQVSWEIVKLMPMVLNPAVSPFFWPVFLIVFLQYRRIARMEEDLYGRVLNPPLRSTVTASLYGLLGGFLGSLLLVALGVSLRQGDVIFLLPVALLLMLVHPRLLCFSYAGGLISVSHLTLGWPDINVPAVMGLVAVLHLVEGLLVSVNGSQVRTPLFVRTSEGQVVGGFSMQRFWPLPLVVLLFLQVDPRLVTDGISMPQWWPLIAGKSPTDAGNWVHIMLPVAAALGYADIALTSAPVRKARASARHLVLYSLGLLAVSILAVRLSPLVWAAALIGPGAHELMVRAGSLREQKGVPYFSLPPNGVRVLEVLKGSVGESMGLQSGDVVLTVGGCPVNSPREMGQELDRVSRFLALEFRRGTRAFQRVHRWDPELPGGLGVILVPGPGDSPHVILGTRSGLASLRSWLRGRRGKKDEGSGS